MQVQGSLMRAVQTIFDAGNAANLAVLIIDENASAVNNQVETGGALNPDTTNVTRNQQHMIRYAQRYDCHIWNVTFFAANRSNLTALLDPNSPRLHQLAKPEANAFWKTTLHADLQHAGITTLVAMGWQANACVRATCGSNFIPDAFALPNGVANYDAQNDGMAGACHLGYRVLTCHGLQHHTGNAGAADWDNYPNHPVKFYTTF